MLHNVSPPTATLSRLLTSTPVLAGNYGHLLLEQRVDALGDDEIDEFRPYFESAHLDARETFHRAARISLHPEAAAAGAHATYPNCLPAKTVRGLFGEVMTGMIAQAYPLIGGKTWRIPIFLFRYHGPVERYVFDLVRDPTKVKEIHGRAGNDFIGLELAAKGQVVSFIAGEAKWRTDLKPSGMIAIMKGDGKGKGAARVYENNGVWNDINTALAVPQGIQQICDLLIVKDRDGHAATILSLDAALLGQSNPPRTDLVLVAGNRAPSRGVGTTYLPTAAPPADYTAGRPLQIVELVLSDGETFIDDLYKRMWT